MKKIIGLICSILTLGLAQAAEVGYVDSDLILSKMPEYNSAQKQLDELAANWQSQAEQMQTQLDQMWKNFQAEKPLLTDDQIMVKQQAIVDKEAEMFKFKEAKFGTNGELFKKREELIKPIQDKVYAAVQKIAKKNGLKFMFDKAGGVLMLYADEKADYTSDVLEELGVVSTN